MKAFGSYMRTDWLLRSWGLMIGGIIAFLVGIYFITRIGEDGANSYLQYSTILFLLGIVAFVIGFWIRKKLINKKVVLTNM